MKQALINGGVSSTPISETGTTAKFTAYASQLSIRTLLQWLVLACMMPAILGTSILLLHNFSTARVQREEDTLQTSRAMLQAVDAQIAQALLLAATLTTSDALLRRDFEGFHQRALRLIREVSFVQSVLIYERNGNPLVNSRVPFGQVLPRRTDLKQIESIFESGKPSKSEVILSPLTHLPVISIAVPVFSGTKVEYALAMGIAPDVFNSILSKQNLPPNWVASVFDQLGKTAARSRSNDEFAGKNVNKELLKRLTGPPEGSFQTVTKDGIPAFIVYSRSSVTNWSVAIAIPNEDLSLIHI